VLVAIYGILTILVKTQEGLSDGSENANTEVIKKITTNSAEAKGVIDALPASSNAYIDLLNSYKNNKIANGINQLAFNKSTPNLTTISDYNEAIDYLKTMNSSNVSEDVNVTADITNNNTDTNNALNNLKADNQAYIDLLTSYKNKKMAEELASIAANGTTLSISDCDHVIDYLNELSGSPVSNPATTLDVPTTPNISLLKKN
jgi:hypothetical protein